MIHRKKKIKKENYSNQLLVYLGNKVIPKKTKPGDIRKIEIIKRILTKKGTNVCVCERYSLELLDKDKGIKIKGLDIGNLNLSLESNNTIIIRQYEL